MFGDLFGGLFGDDVELPTLEAPTEQETQILNQILGILNTNADLAQQYLPVLMQSTGYRYTTDDTGAPTGIEKIPWDEFLSGLNPVTRGAYENLALMQERQAAALGGELPVSPTLEKEIEENRQTLQEQLSRSLGSNYARSTAGAQGLAEFEEGATRLREEDRRNEIAQLSGLTGSLSQAYGLTPSQQYETLTQFPSVASGLSGVPTYLSSLDPYQQERMWNYQAGLQNAQLQAKEQAGLMSLFGQGLGALGTAKKSSGSTAENVGTGLGSAIGYGFGGPAGGTIGGILGGIAGSFF